MKKLKTLKELEKDLLIFYGACSHCNQIDYSKIKGDEHPLKKEAIKWIKKIRGSLDVRMEPNAYMYFLNESNLFAIFFNITEGDLK